MRTLTVLVAAGALLALAAPAAASDYMLPPLLEQRPEPYSVADPTGPAPQDAGILRVATPLQMGVALLAAALVVALTMAFLVRADRRDGSLPPGA